MTRKLFKIALTVNLLTGCFHLTGCYHLREHRPDVEVTAQYASVVTSPITRTASAGVSTRELEDEDTLMSLHLVSMPTFTLERGDQLSLKVYGEPDLTVDSLQILPDGTAELPLVGSTLAAGRTLDELQHIVVAAYGKYLRKPQVHLSAKQLKNRAFTVLGQVQNPGNYALEAPVPLLEALAKAGGPAKQDLNLEQAYVMRQQRVLPVNFEALFQGDARYNIPILPGDFIYFPAPQSQEIYVLGQMKRPGRYAYQKSLRLSHALAGAEGHLGGAHLGAVHILRGDLKSPVRYVVNYHRILAGEAPDIMLQPGDVIFVPPDAIQQFSRVMDLVMPALQVAQSGALLYSLTAPTY